MILWKVEQMVAEVEKHKDDPEEAHMLEDALYVEVLHAIANGAENAAELAREALKAEEVDFPRWYA